MLGYYRLGRCGEVSSWFENQGGKLLEPLHFLDDGGSGGDGGNGTSRVNSVNGGDGGIVDVAFEESDPEEIPSTMIN